MPLGAVIGVGVLDQNELPDGSIVRGRIVELAEMAEIRRNVELGKLRGWLGGALRRLSSGLRKRYLRRANEESRSTPHAQDVPASSHALSSARRRETPGGPPTANLAGNKLIV